MISDNKPIVLVIVGPTASGKTSVSIELAKELNGEIVSADSMQIYQEMNIGTAKPSIVEREGIPHHLIDFLEPNQDFNVTKYQKLAEETIANIVKRNKMPIVVGGTGLYVKALVDAVAFSEVPENPAIREELMKIAQEKGNAFLHHELMKVDAEAALKIDSNNIRRVIRALEIYQLTGKTKTELDRESLKEPNFSYLMYAIDWNREELYARIEKRIDIMLEEGLIEEVKNIRQKYELSKTALQGIGYKEVIEYIENKISYEEMIEKLKTETRRYAKRQLTWFRADKRIKWCEREEIVMTILEDLKKLAK